MPTIIFTDHEGTERRVPAAVGDTLMRTARDNDVPGIVAECGGCCACATCGVFVDRDWFQVVGPPGDIEESMLECCLAAGPFSRLSCQVTITDAMDGLRVTTPERQQ